MKVKVLDLCVVDENKNVHFSDEKDLFEYENGKWEDYVAKLNSCNLDNYKLKVDDVDKDVFIIDDGGELIRLKDGSYIEICWRMDLCRMWKENDEERIKYFEEKLIG